MTSVTAAVQTAQQALDSARRAGGDKTKVRALEREVERLRRKASQKAGEITQHEQRAQVWVGDPLSRRSLGTFKTRVSPTVPPPPPPRDERITAAQQRLRVLRAQITTASTVEELTQLRESARDEAAVADAETVAPRDAQSVRDLLRTFEQTVAARESDLTATADRTDPDVIHASSGEKHAWTKLLNNPPPNTTIVVDEQYVYETDSLGRTVKAQTVLSNVVDKEFAKEAKAWLRHKSQQTHAGGADRLTKAEGGRDEGGHIFGTLFGGPGEAVNLQAMEYEINQTTYRELERIWESQIKDGGIVNASVEFQFEGDSGRPSSFDVTFDFDDGNSVSIPFYQ